MRKQLLYLLLAGAIAFISSMLTVLYTDRSSELRDDEPQDMVETMNAVYNKLQLDSLQVEAFNRITGQFHKENKTISSELRQNLHLYYEELSSNSPDSAVLENCAAKNGELNRRLMQNSSWYYHQTGSILNASQLEKLKGIYKLAVMD